MATVVIATMTHTTSDGTQGAELLMDDVTLAILGVRMRNSRSMGRQIAEVSLRRTSDGARETFTDLTNNREEDISGRGWVATESRGEVSPGVSMGFRF